MYDGLKNVVCGSWLEELNARIKSFEEEIVGVEADTQGASYQEEGNGYCPDCLVFTISCKMKKKKYISIGYTRASGVIFKKILAVWVAR